VESWVWNGLVAAAITYQNFARDISQEIIERMNDMYLRQTHQGTQLAHLNNALAFLSEANTAQNQYLAIFVTPW